MSSSPCFIYWTATASKLFKKLPKNIQKKLRDEIHLLKLLPEKGPSLKGKYRDLRSLHTSAFGVSYRIIYRYESNEVTVVLTSTRENLYKKLDEMKITQ